MRDQGVLPEPVLLVVTQREVRERVTAVAPDDVTSAVRVRIGLMASHDGPEELPRGEQHERDTDGTERRREEVAAATRDRDRVDPDEPLRHCTDGAPERHAGR